MSEMMTVEQEGLPFEHEGWVMTLADMWRSLNEAHSRCKAQCGDRLFYMGRFRPHIGNHDLQQAMFTLLLSHVQRNSGQSKVHLTPRSPSGLCLPLHQDSCRLP